MYSPDGQDYKDLARALVGLLEVARHTLSEEEAPSELVARVTGHLGCDLPEVIAGQQGRPAGAGALHAVSVIPGPAARAVKM